jgi:A/G-specific adenine glycosylase
VTADAPAIRRRLLSWFRANARLLPWRTSRDPYRIWISEVMLQQTQVATVIPYFRRFLKQLPTLTKLAQADEQAVLRLWEGLGYYRRARDLSCAAKILVEAEHRTIPNDPDYVRTLPGFGRYTTNAVLSQAYDRRLPILEANSQRVLCRLFGIEQIPKDTAVQKSLWRLAESLLPARSIGDFNQAMMELGALVCTPTKPGCAKCPLREHCQARLQNRQHEIPRRTQSPDTIAVEEVAVIIRKAGRLLLVQRPAHGRWANMWEFPHHKREPGESADSAVHRQLATLGIDADVLGEVGTIRHAVTRFNITMTCLLATHRRGKLPTAAYADAIWVRLEDLHGYPLSMPQRKLAKLLATDGTRIKHG